MPSAFGIRLQRFYTLSTAEIDIIEAMLGEPESIPKGTIICSDRIHDKELPIILLGTAVKSHYLRNGARQISGLLLPGDMALLSRISAHAFHDEIIALTSCKVAWIPQGYFTRNINNLPQFANTIQLFAASEFSYLLSWLINIGKRDALERVAYFICELHHRLSNVQMVTDGCFELPLVQYEIADCLGLSSVHVSRKIQQLRDEGLAEFRSGQVKIFDLDRLRCVADYDGSYVDDQLAKAAPGNRQISNDLR